MAQLTEKWPAGPSPGAPARGPDVVRASSLHGSSPVLPAAVPVSPLRDRDGCQHHVQVEAGGRGQTQTPSVVLLALATACAFRVAGTSVAMVQS